MAIPDYADPRAHKHFSEGFVGTSHGDPGRNGYKTSWDAVSEAKPTSTMGTVATRRYCIYCGQRAFPIQHAVGSEPHGYACVCKDAMDEVDWKAELTALLNEQAKAREAIMKRAPKRNMEVIAQFTQKLWNGMEDDIRKDHLSEHAYKRMGITFEDPTKVNHHY